ncbi:MAG: substrate-binding domain-containing protein, partial [Chloroherpetonaceae bacterium]|nr:substrate-binding domain-containing protein [Chloroherpetonaceae bacterium]
GIVASVSPLSCIQERIVSFREKVEEYGAEAVYVRAVGPKEDDRDFGRRAAHSLLDLPHRPTALFSTDAPGAVSILRGIRERGLCCPGDVAVATFDDDVYAPYLETPLTSVSWPAFEIGREAARLLLKRVRSEVSGPPQRILLPPTLIHRESTLGTRRGAEPVQPR